MKASTYFKIGMAILGSVVLLPFGFFFTMKDQRNKKASTCDQELLRKIRLSGYSSLSREEKAQLFKDTGE